MGMIETTRVAEPTSRTPQRWDLWHLVLVVVLSLIIGGALTQVWRTAVDTVPGCDSAQHDAAMVSLATARARVANLTPKDGHSAIQAMQQAESQFLAMCAPARDFESD
jgi:hypothetical protein